MDVGNSTDGTYHLDGRNVQIGNIVLDLLPLLKCCYKVEATLIHPWTPMARTSTFLLRPSLPLWRALPTRLVSRLEAPIRDSMVHGVKNSRSLGENRQEPDISEYLRYLFRWVIFLSRSGFGDRTLLS